jgi:DNA replication protein DnaD
MATRLIEDGMAIAEARENLTTFSYIIGIFTKWFQDR